MSLNFSSNRQWASKGSHRPPCSTPEPRPLGTTGQAVAAAGAGPRAAGGETGQSCSTISLHTTGRDGLSVNSWLSPNRKQRDGRDKPSPYNQTSPRPPYAVCPLTRTQPHSFGIHSSPSRPSCSSPRPYWGKDGPTTNKQTPGDQGKGAWEPELHSRGCGGRWL